MPAVSIIIPTFNRSLKVTRAISSVLQQSFTDFEIIVVDDSSTDGTRENLTIFDDKITIISHHSNLGVSAARNTGILYSRAPLIAFLDSDDYWLPDKLAVQIAFFRDHPKAIICQTEEIWIRNGLRVNPKKKHIKPSGDIFKASLKLCLVSPSAVMLKRTLFEQTGLFDVDLPACEDYDLWLRISCFNPIILIPQYLVVKEGGHSDQLSAKYKGMDRFRIKAILKLVKNAPLTEKQLQDALNELVRKCNIYGTGCIKRGKLTEGSLCFQIIKQIQKLSNISGDPFTSLS